MTGFAVNSFTLCGSTVYNQAKVKQTTKFPEGKLSL